MALADILKRIDTDAEREAAAIIDAAEREAERLRAEVERWGATYRDVETARIEREATEEAHTRLAAARLRGRDASLGEKRSLIERVLRRAEERIVGLPDERYAQLIAAHVARVARGGEQVAVGRSDADRLHAHLPAVLAERGSDVEVSETTGAIDRGVLVEGARMRVEVSPAALVESRRTELETLVSEVLFGGESSE